MDTSRNNPEYTPRQRASEAALFPLNLIASGLEVIFCIPFAGRLLKWLWNTLLTGLHFLPGMFEFLGWQLGFRPVKKFKVGVIVLSDENGEAVKDSAVIAAALKRTADLYMEKARIKLLPAVHLPKALSKDDTPGEDWVTVVDYQQSKRILDVGCNGRAVWEDIYLSGTSYQMIHLREFYFTSFRRTFGYGSPVTVFIVRDVEKKGGCSMGWLSDYVTIPCRHLRCIPHELGHALSLFHRSDPQNLMYPKSCSVTQLTNWQIAVMRASRHVTFF